MESVTSCVVGLNSTIVENEKIQCMRQFSKNRNQNCKNYPGARWKHAAVIYRNNLYIMGGCSWTTILKDLWSLNINSFSESIQDQISIRGFWNVFDAHDSHKELWQDLSYFVGSIPPLQSHTMIAYDNKLYIFGGTFVYDAKDCPLWVFSLEYNSMLKWKAMVNDEVPAPRRNHSCSIYRDTMLIFGGFGDVRGSFGDLWAFDLKIHKWHLVWSCQGYPKDSVYTIYSGGPCARHDHSSVIHQNSLWIYGGMSGLEECNDLWQWNFDHCQWTRISYKIGPISLQFTSNVMIGHNWIFYGYNESKARSEKWKFSFKLAKWIFDITNIPKICPHSTISLTNCGNSKLRSIRKSPYTCLKKNKIYPITDADFYSLESSEFADEMFCLKSCVTINSRRVDQLSVKRGFDTLTPVDLLPDEFSSTYFDNQETTFIENVDDSIAPGSPRPVEYVFLLGNNIDKCSFEDSIGIMFHLL